MSSGPPRAKHAESDAAHRRRMRKGTKSCLPCRSRKIRCTYPAQSRTCDSCTAHGRECVEQTYQEVKNGGLDKRVGLKQRVRELETLVQRLVEKGGPDAQAIESSARNGPRNMLSPPHSLGGRSNGNDTTSPAGLSTEASVEEDDEDSSEAYDSLDDLDGTNDVGCEFEKAPLMALFDNNMFLRDDPKEAPKPAASSQMGLFSVSRHGASTRARQARVAEQLRELIPPWPILQEMLNHDKGLLSLWKLLLSESDFLGVKDLEEGLKELSQSEQPAEVCKALAVLTLILQQTPEGASDQIPTTFNGKRHTELLQKYIETIESNLYMSDAVIGSLEGLECTVLFCRIIFNAGRPRKAWLLYERALSFARLLGFHRASSWKTAPDPTIGRRREQMWWHLFVGSRGVSLLLGLPYSILDAHVGIDGNMPAETYARSMGPFNSFYMRLGIITGRIIDRNHQTSSNAAALYGETMKIDGELHSLEVTMPKKWLSLCEEEGTLSEFMEMGLKEMFEAANAQIWHHECRIALHMPYMMRNFHYGNEAGKYEYSRAVGTRSARSLIRSHMRLRERTELSNVVCQVVDFQVFMSAVLIILDMLSQSKGAGVTKLKERSEESLKDEKLVREAYVMLDRLAKQNTNKTNIPSQATKVLDTLGHLISGEAVPGAEHGNHRIVIPYFGAITIKPSKALSDYRREIISHYGSTECAPPLSESVSNSPAPNPTARGFQTVEVNQPGTQANDLTFDSFVAPQPATLPGFPAHMADPAMQASIPFDYSSVDFSNLPPPTEMDIDAQMWSDNVWQNMLTQDLSLDLDVDWGTLPVGEAV